MLLIFGFGPIFLILWGWLALVEKRPFWTMGLERQGFLYKYLRGGMVGLVMFVASIALPALLGYITFEQDSLRPQGLAALGAVLVVLLGWVVQGAAEEAVARGWLMPVIGARYRPVWGILTSSLVFAVLHSLNPNLSPIGVLNLFLFGIFTALYALYEGGLWGVFSLHSVWNWAQGNLFGFEVSGQDTRVGTLFDLMEAGPDPITGGPFGPEGGLAVTLVLLVGCGIIWWLGRNRTPGSYEASL
jgi:membrane protease YdiL (CAAX protease family)